jgi:hypothetical protein
VLFGRQKSRNDSTSGAQALSERFHWRFPATTGGGPPADPPQRGRPDPNREIGFREMDCSGRLERVNQLSNIIIS